MYTVILVTIVGIIFPWIVIKDSEIRHFDAEDWGLGILFSALFGVIGGLVGAGIAVPLSQDVEEHKVKYELQCLNDNQSIKYLGRGRIDGSVKYAFYLKNPDGLFELKVVNHKDAKIRLVDGPPSVEVTSFSTIIGWGIDANKPDQYIFNVPKGTIDNNFTLDAK
jgi:hypothetical protein